MYLNNEDTKTLIDAVEALNNTGNTEIAERIQEIVDKLKSIKKQRSDYVNKQNKILRGTYKGD